MNKLFTLINILLLFIACDNNIEKKAAERLTLAREALEHNDYSEAKKHIDSIKILYPKAFAVRKEGDQMIQQINLKEQEQGLAYLENAFIEKQTSFEAVKNKFVLERNAEYQETGNYFWPTQTVEKNINRSYLRFQVSERGTMSMTSIYCGTNRIRHTSVKVMAPDGSFAETPASNNSYETTNFDIKIEKADYPLGKDGNVIGFIYLNRNKNIRLEYLGGSKYVTTMNASDRQAAAELYELSQLLSSIEQIKKEIEETTMHMKFIKRNMNKSSIE